MKKILTIISSLAAIFFASCSKDVPANNGKTEVTITVGLSDLTTKAVADNDGNAAKANRWVFEARDAQGAVFYKEVKTSAAGTLQQTFKVTFIKNQTYDLLFWADNNGGYYNADDLTNVCLANAATYAANDDARDAFTACKSFTATSGGTVSAQLYRPFAQLNIITTDLPTLWDQAKTTADPDAAYAKIEPKTLVAKLKVPTSYNVLTQTCGAVATTSVVITADNCYKGYLDDKTTPQTKNNFYLKTNPATLFMDYVFATKAQKDVVDIEFEFSNPEKVSYSFTAIPLQANYRTNIKGKLLSNETEINVEINPGWLTPENDVAAN